MALSKTWWLQTNGPANFLQGVSHDICHGGCICLPCRQKLPWPRTFRELTLEKVRQQCCSLKINEPVNLQSIPDASPRWLLETFVPALADDFFSSRRLAAFLKSRPDALKNQLIWLCNGTEYQEKVWFEQIADIAVTIKDCPFTFLLETSFFDKRKKVYFIPTENISQPFDYVQFSTIAANAYPDSESSKVYLSYLFMELIQNYPENLEPLLENRKNFLEDPVRIGCNCLNLSKEECSSAVRRAQIKLLLPAIENFRSTLLEKYHNRWQSCLPFRDDHETLCTEVYNMELRHMNYQGNSCHIPEDVQEGIACVCNARNDLVHCMQPLEVKELRNALTVVQEECGNTAIF